MIEVLALPGDGEKTTWEVRRDGALVGTARTGLRRGGLLLTGLDVPVDHAAGALDAILGVARDRGDERLTVDVAAGDRVLEAALRGRDAPLTHTQMLLDLSHPVAGPPRVVLRALTPVEFAGYRDRLVAAYAQDMLDVGVFSDRDLALDASERSTEELLPEGVDTPGQHLWWGVDGDVVVGILWIHVDGAKGYIYDVEVHEEQRRRGYGRELLDAGARAAVELGATSLGLNVFGHNEGARALYERAGYATTEQTFRLAL